MASSGSPASQSRILVGLVLGAIAGVSINTAIQYQLIDRTAVEWIVRTISRPIGDIFINLLFLAIIPLVFASLALGVTRLGGTSNLGRIGAKMMAFFLLTTLFAGVIGLFLVNVLQPGKSLPPEQREKLMEEYDVQTKGTLQNRQVIGVQTIVNIVPRNPLEALLKRDMLAIIFTALLVGVALTRISPDVAAPLIALFEAVNQIAEFILRTAMLIAPLGVFALIFSTTALFGVELLKALGLFVITVLIGQIVHLVFVLLPLVRILGGMSPIAFLQKCRTALVTAFSTSSSSATLPTTMRCAEEELGISRPISRFVLPLGASMNHNGTALFEGVTALFLAQAFGVDLTLQQQLLVLVLCIITATGMAGVPGGSLPLLGMVLSAVDIPEGAIAVVLGVDRILDMMRTMVNVAGDLVTVVYLERSERQGNGEISGSTNDATASDEDKRTLE